MRELAKAKVNIFLKITGKRDDYHTISSRFMLVDNLFDVISFTKKENPTREFILDGDFSCKLEQNTIFKAYNLIKNKKVTDFFNEYKVVVKKSIPEFAGLGGGSSDSASFLRLTNRVLDLNIDTDSLASIGAKIGADVPFFVYNYNSANVTGIGEIVEEFKENSLNIKTFTPDIECDTAKVYKKFTESYLNSIDLTLSNDLLKQNSLDILNNYQPKELNDLLSPSLDLYPNLAKYDGFFSGSGSTFFRIENG